MTEPHDLAFPLHCQGPPTGPEVYYGLTKRELFAAMFGAGLCANPESPVANDIVVESVKLADRLIAELNKEQK